MEEMQAGGAGSVFQNSKSKMSFPSQNFKAMSDSIPRSTDPIPSPHTHTLQIFEAMGDYIPKP